MLLRLWAQTWPTKKSKSLICVNTDGQILVTADMMWLYMEIVVKTISNSHFKGFQDLNHWFINDLFILTYSLLSLPFSKFSLWTHCPPLALWFLFAAAPLEGCCSGQPPGSATSLESECCFWAAAVSWGKRQQWTLPLQFSRWPQEKGSHAAGAAQSPAALRCPGIPGTGILVVKRKKLWKMSRFYLKIAYFEIRNGIL